MGTFYPYLGGTTLGTQDVITICGHHSTKCGHHTIIEEERVHKNRESNLNNCTKSTGNDRYLYFLRRNLERTEVSLIFSCGKIRTNS